MWHVKWLNFTKITENDISITTAVGSTDVCQNSDGNPNPRSTDKITHELCYRPCTIRYLFFNSLLICSRKILRTVITRFVTPSTTVRQEILKRPRNLPILDLGVLFIEGSLHKLIYSLLLWSVTKNNDYGVLLFLLRHGTFQ